uniref:HMG box domain-containing protein n=1 Tax=Amphora coffeiformis TaxID=265554 RepID=A0A7S3LGL9_9STRA
MTTTKKSQKMKFKKAPGAPKRFKSAYMFFSENMHKVIRLQENRKIRAAEVAKMVSQTWKSLSGEERAPWIEMGREDRERYEREKASYKGPWKIPDVKDPNAPKKPQSAFLAFSNERRKIVAKANPGMSGNEISSLMSQLWKECPEHMKQAYRDQEARERKTFKKAFADWERKKDAELVACCHSDADSTGDNSSNHQDETITLANVEQQQFTSSRLLKKVEKELLSFDFTEAIPSNTAATDPAEMLMGSMKIAFCSPTMNSDTFPGPTLPSDRRTHTVSQGTVDGKLPSFNRVPKTITLPSASIYENYSLEDIFNDDDFAPRPIAPTRLSGDTGSVATGSALLPNAASFSSLFAW